MTKIEQSWLDLLRDDLIHDLMMFRIKLELEVVVTDLEDMIETGSINFVGAKNMMVVVIVKIFESVKIVVHSCFDKEIYNLAWDHLG